MADPFHRWRLLLFSAAARRPRRVLRAAPGAAAPRMRLRARPRKPPGGRQ
jgi:hypothetical protein